MRNRVTFSYLNNNSINITHNNPDTTLSSDDYVISSDYSDTIFITYSDKYSEVYKDKIRYTYLKNGSTGYTYHGLGITYLRDINNVTTLNEEEFERYKYNIIDDSENVNNNKIIDTSDLREQIITKIGTNNVNAYTYFPNFIEGFGGKKYSLNKFSYNISTNMMLSDTNEITLNKNDLYLQNNTSLSYNSKGLYKNNRIVGVSFETSSSINSNIIFSGVNYTNCIYAYVFVNDDNGIKRITNDLNLYKSFTFTLPGVDDNYYETKYNSNYASLTIKDSNHHVGGNVLVKVSFNWENNKYTLCKQINFSALHQDLNDSIEDVSFIVDNNVATTIFIEGDIIKSAEFTTEPNTVQGTGYLKISTSTNSFMSKSYDGEFIKSTTIPEPCTFTLSGTGTSYNIKQLNNSNNVDSLRVVRYFTSLENTTVPKTVANRTKSFGLFKLSGTNCNLKNKTTIDDPQDVYGKFDISNFGASGKYTHNLNNRIIASIIYDYSRGVGETETYDVDNASFEYKNYINSYSFSHRIETPGIYDYKCILRHNNVETTTNLGSYIYNSIEDSDAIIELDVYEGEYGISIIGDSSYEISDESLTTYNGIEVYDLFDNNESFHIGHISNDRCIISPVMSTSTDETYSITPLKSLLFNSTKNKCIFLRQKYNVNVHRLLHNISIHINNQKSPIKSVLGHWINVNENTNIYDLGEIDLSNFSRSVLTDNDGKKFYSIRILNSLQCLSESFYNDTYNDKMFEITLSDSEYIRGIDVQSRYIDNLNEQEISARINENDLHTSLKNNNNSLEFMFKNKLNRLDQDNIDDNMWDELGFKYCYNIIKFKLIYNKASADNINGKNIILLSNVSEENSGIYNNSYDEIYVSNYDHIVEAELLNIELNDQILSNTAKMYIIHKNGTYSLKNSKVDGWVCCIEQDGYGKISFTPNYEATEHKIIIKLNSVDYTLYILPVKFNSIPKQSLYYLTDIKNNNKLYQEYDLIDSYKNKFNFSNNSNDSIFISFDSFPFDTDDIFNVNINNNSIELNAANNFNNSSNGYYTNVKSVKLNINNSNCNIHNYNNSLKDNGYVIIPTSTSNVELSLTHKYNGSTIIEMLNIVFDMKPVKSLSNIKLYTNGDHR